MNLVWRLAKVKKLISSFWQYPMLEIMGKQNLKDAKLITPSSFNMIF